MIDAWYPTMKLAHHFTTSRRERGVTLIEALVALLVMSFGMVALVALLGNLRRATDVGKQRSEAMRLALKEVAAVRAFSTLVKPTPTISDYDTDIVSTAAATVTVADSNTSFVIQRTVAPLVPQPASPSATDNTPLARSVQVDVSWVDRASRSTDAAQTLTLSTLVARVEPSFSGALGIAPPPGGVRQPRERHPAIPNGAVDVGNKTSAYRPSGLSSVTWVFNNTSGMITRLCTIAPATALTSTSVAAASCTTTLAFVVSGAVNFSSTSPANPSLPEAYAVGLDMTIDGGSYSAARLDTNGVPVQDASNNVIWDTVSVSAPSFQCFDDALVNAPTPQAFVNYSCIVYPYSGSSPPYWSGVLKLTGLSLGNNASDYRVCRYSADYNGNGNGYANVKLEPDNFEHPGFYVKVTGPLARQNFLVVRGDVSCPTAPAVNLSTGVFVDYSTIQLQP